MPYCSVSCVYAAYMYVNTLSGIVCTLVCEPFTCSLACVYVHWCLISMVVLVYITLHSLLICVLGVYILVAQTVHVCICIALQEEEKRVKREEKRKVDQERKLQRDHADREKLQVQQQGGMSMSAPKTAKKDVDKTRFEQLLTTTSANPFVQHWKQLNGKQMSPSEHQHGSNASYLYSTVTNSQSSPKLQHYEEASTLNCTFTKDCTDGGRDTKVHLTTPAQSSKHPHVQNLTNSKYTTASSYEMTPVGQDPLLVTYKNYDIDDLSSEDSTDDESCPKKLIPLWARPSVLNEVMLAQEEGVNCKSVDIDKIFPPEQLLKVSSPTLCDLI